MPQEFDGENGEIIKEVIIEKEVVDYEMFEGRIQREFKNVFTDTTDLPRWQRTSIIKLHKKLKDDLKSRENKRNEEILEMADVNGNKINPVKLCLEINKIITLIIK